MKPIYLLAILLLSISSYAQNHHPFKSQDRYNIPLNGSTDNHILRILQINNESHSLTSNTLENASLIQVYDSIYRWISIDPDNGLKLDYKITEMLCDDSYNLTSKLMQKWNGSAWINHYSYMYTFDAACNKTAEVLQSWIAGNWVYSSQSIYAYDANNNLSTKIDQQWNNNTWENDNFITFTYDVNNKLTSETFQNWNGQNWINLTKDVYVYEGSNNPAYKIYQYWNGSAWKDDNRFQYFYDASNNLMVASYQHWSGNEWLYRSQYIYTYDYHNNMTVELKQEREGTNWVNSAQRVCDYDSHNNLTGELHQNWNGAGWTNSQRYRYTYDDNSFMISQTFEYWNMAGTEILGGDSTYYYFHTALGVDELSLPEKITIYPNPCMGRFTIQYNSTAYKTEIYNSSGQLVYQNRRKIAGTAKVIDLSSYPGGLYIINIYTDKKNFKTKIIYQ